jgi:hypothetical protein
MMEKQAKEYYAELLVYRFNQRKQSSQALTRIKDQDFLKNTVEIRLFDETDYLLTPDQKRLMNERLQDMQLRF